MDLSDLPGWLEGYPEIHDIVGTELPILEFDYDDPDLDFDKIRKTMQYSHDIGGSEAASIMGVSRYGGQFASYSQKMGLAPVPDLSDKDPVKLGKIYEDTVRIEAEQRLSGSNPGDVVIQKPNATYRHPVHKWMTMNLDGIVMDRRDPHKLGLCEIKTTDSYDRFREVKGGGIPEDWKMQMHHYACFRIPKGYVGAGLPFTYLLLVVKQSLTKPCIIVTTPIDWELCREIIKTQGEFVKRLENADPPQPDGTEGDTEALKHLPLGDGVASADEGYRELRDAYKHASKMRDQYAQESKECANQIRKRMSDEGLNKVIGVASFQTRKSFSQPMMKEKLRENNLLHLMDECKVEGKPFIKIT